MTQNPQPAAVTLSFDFEIGWGDITNPMWERRQNAGVYRRLRNVLPEILAAMDAMEIPATWAAVGGMIDDPQTIDLEHLPADAKTKCHSILQTADQESFDGRDLFEMVLASKAKHQIASHSYSHVPLNWAGTDAAFLTADLERFGHVLKQYGLHADRYVFPENREGHFDQLAEHGFTTVRAGAETRFKNRYLYLATIGFVAPPLVVERTLSTGNGNIVRHAASMLFNDATNPRRIPILQRRVSLGLGQLAKKGGAFHIWAHPFNFAESLPLKTAFLSLLELLARKRDKGEFVFRPM